VGLTILEPLSKLDAVAYLRFASVYQAFENLEDFEGAIALLRKDAVGDALPEAEAPTPKPRKAKTETASTKKPKEAPLQDTLL
jgi:transcriptional repressor nrdR